jgi:hypothetical protein
MVLQHVDVGKLMSAMSESNTPSISGTPTSSVSGIASVMQPTSSTGSTGSTGSIITDVIEKIGKKIQEMPNSNTSDSSTNTNRFFRDVGKNLPTNTNTNTNTNVPIKKDGPSSKELKEISNNNRRAEIETGIVGSIFGSTPAYIVYYILFAISLAFRLFILFIIFNICVVIHKAIQLSLDATHKVMGGVKTSLTDINGFLNKVGFKFTIPGMKKIKWFPFNNSLGNPINKVDSAKRAIPKDANDVIINMIRDTLKGIIELIPKIFEGLIQMFEKIMK